MSNQKPYFHKSGTGPYVLCLHSSTGSSKQWKALIEKLSGEYTVIAPDLYGYGKSPEWNKNRALELEDEIDLLKPVLDIIHGPFHLVGHSYGAAVAFKLALTHPQRIRSLTAYEPVLFNLLFEMKEEKTSTEIWMVSDDVYWLSVDKRYADAGRRFIDYWTGEGSWDKLPKWMQESIEKRMEKVSSDFDATLGNPTPLSAYKKLNVPTLLLYGLQSPQSTQRIAEWIGSELPNAEIRGLLSLGHMGPVTHAENIANIIMKFIKNQPLGIQPHQIKKQA
jgi:pimeloyl-ACP methyl ester carboxylesterase